MYQIQGVAKAHPFAAYDVESNATAVTLTEPVCKYRINGGSVATFTPTISAYNSDMKTFSITIPAELAINAYDSIEVFITAVEGEAHLLIDVALDINKFIYKMRYKTKLL